MYRFFVNPEQIAGSLITITGDDVNHMKNVLRLKVGEQFTASNEAKEYLCEIVTMNSEEVVGTIIDVYGSNAELPAAITLFQCVPKGDKLETIIQKAVELGATQIVPVFSKRCVVKLDAKKAEKKQARYQAIAESAAKQSKRVVIPTVHPFVTYQEALAMAKDMDLLMIPYEEAQGMENSRKVMASASEAKRIGIFIGPEGGFEKSEVDTAIAYGAKCITLGHRILRTETAGMAVLSILMYQLDQDSEM